jgi:peptidoglycan/xylan/chitin deacetylase (PgdA/CDA1 family)
MPPQEWEPMDTATGTARRHGSSPVIGRRVFTVSAAALFLSACGGTRDQPATPESLQAGAALPLVAESVPETSSAVLPVAAEPVPETPSQALPAAAKPVPETSPAAPPAKEQIMVSATGKVPHQWGLQVPGAVTRLTAGSSGVVLTFDCCGGPGGNDVDQALIDTLVRTGTPATFFLNYRWIQANPGAAKSLAENPLFEIGNHGTRHVPLSVSGRSAYGISGTASPAAVYDEIMVNQDALHRLTGKEARYFRPGTGYSDEIAAGMVRELGLVLLSFSINGDAGATYPAAVVTREVATAVPGDIVIAHANRPKGGTAAGIARALPLLQGNGRIAAKIPPGRW